MSENENKKIKRKIYPNIGMIVFFVIVIYILGYIMTYLERDKLAIYEVAGNDIKDTVEGTGIAIRDEELILTKNAGYISPYVKDGAKVRAGGTVYTLDTTGKVQEFIDAIASEKSDNSQEEKDSIINDLRAFGESYDDDRFREVYDTKNDIQRDLTAYTDTIMAQNKDAFNELYGEGSYTEFKTEEAGIISYQSDGMETKTVEGLSKDDFGGKNNMQDLRTTKKVEVDTPVYRIITTQTWHVVMKLSQDEYLKLKELSNRDTTQVNVEFNKDDFKAKAMFECYMKDNEYFVNLTFDKYVQRYMNQRYLWIRIVLSEADGLIVPTSSITFKEAYKISSDYLTKSDEGESGDYVNVVNGDKIKQIKVDIIKKKNDNVYVISTELRDGDTLTDAKKKETTIIESKVKVRGVFVVNQGYASFEPVELKERTEDYCILYEQYSEIQMYDRIILHSDSIKENQIIY